MRVQVSQHFRNRPQHKFAPFFLNKRETMYAAGFRNAVATLLRLPTLATKLAIIFAAFAHDFCEIVTMCGLNMKIKKYECL
jgi:hypothetical protein